MHSRHLTRISPATAFALAAVLVASALLGAATSATAGGGDDCYAIDFLYDDGATDVGTYCGYGNELSQTDIPELTATTLHVSCSDQFPGGVPEKSDLGGRTVTSWTIHKFKGDGSLDKVCGDEASLRELLPDGVEPTGECYVIDFTYDDGSVDAGAFCGTGNDIDRTVAPDLNAVSLHVSCSDTFEFGYSEKSDLGDLRVDLWSIQKYKDGQLDKECAGDPDTSTDLPPFGQECFVIDFQYTTGEADTGTFCETGNDIDRTEAPDLNAVKLHVSCSDTFENGFAEKSDLGGLRVASWSIQRWHDDHFHDPCSGTPELYEVPDGITASGDCFVIDFVYTTGETDAGTYCGTGNDIDRTEAPELNAVKLHVSCSDDFNADGTAEKSDLGGLLIETWSIQKYKDGELNKECAGERTVDGGGTDGGTDGIPQSGKCSVIEFVYTTGEVDAGTFCELGNDITRDEVPTLHALSLHVSCSDDFYPDGTAEKSDLDGLLIASWSIEKYDNGEFKKACGDVYSTPEPPADRCYSYDFSYAATTTSGDDSFDAGYVCNRTLLDQSTDALVAISLDVSCQETDPALIAVLPDNLEVYSYTITIFEDGVEVGGCSFGPGYDSSY